jgi:alkanesulfonate monooxygenase SsuD/methylene tetrahydromethanopterin reductase-like flavin-dependent oxidoreductase (luciferase family)
MSIPFAAGSVSLGLHPASDSPATLLHEAGLAAAAGFDGVSISEHHAGAAGYFPNPLLVAATLLSTVERAWVAACPVVLPLRPVASVVEDVAYLCAAFPGRFGLGIAPGWAGDDFALFDVPAAERRQRFEAQLATLVTVRDGDGPALLRKDPLVAGLRFPPTVSAAGSRTAAMRAGQARVGMILSQFMSPPELRRLIDVYRAAGGPGPVVLIRRVWLGSELPDGLIALMSPQGAWVAGGTSQLVSGSTGAIADRLRSVLDASGADALNLRVHFPGLSTADYASQVGSLGNKVLPEVRNGG